jgi:hypothetical protein
VYLMERYTSESLAFDGARGGARTQVERSLGGGKLQYMILVENRAEWCYCF